MKSSIRKSILIFFVGLSVFFSTESYSQPSTTFQVTGLIKLEEESLHSGVKILYEAASASASTDSTISNSNGEYAINLQGGIYNIHLSKIGFWPKEIKQVLIAKDESFDHDSLRTSKGYKEVGVWIKDTMYADTQYLVVSDIHVQKGHKLYIEPGTVISFRSGMGFYVDGEIDAHGTEEDKIIFKLYKQDTVYWDGIYIDRDTHNINLSHLAIFDSEYGVYVTSARFFHMEECIMDRSGKFMVYSSYVDSTLIEKSEFRNGKETGIFCRPTQKRIVIRNNYFDGMKVRALQGRGNMLIAYNVFTNCGQGIYQMAELVSNNIFFRNEVAAHAYSGKYYNNTFVENDIGFYKHAYFKGDLIMNAFSQNAYAMSFPYMGNDDFEMKYNFFEYSSNFQKHAPLGIGVIIGQNNKGSGVDSYLNVIDSTAEFYTTDLSNRHAFYPLKHSPLVDAGDPTSFDEGGSIKDIGAFPYSPFVGEEEFGKSKNEINVYPNPFVDELNFEIPFKGSFNFSLYDGQGRLVYSTNAANGPRYTVQLDNLENGIYIFQIVTDDNVFTGQVITR